MVTIFPPTSLSSPRCRQIEQKTRNEIGKYSSVPQTGAVHLGQTKVLQLQGDKEKRN